MTCHAALYRLARSALPWIKTTGVRTALHSPPIGIAAECWNGLSI